MTTIRRLLIPAAALLSLAGCGAAPAVMADHYMIGDKSVAILMQRAGFLSEDLKAQLGSDAGAEDLFHVIARICDFDASGKETACKQTLVLPNVFPQSIY